MWDRLSRHTSMVRAIRGNILSGALFLSGGLFLACLGKSIYPTVGGVCFASYALYWLHALACGKFDVCFALHPRSIGFRVAS